MKHYVYALDTAEKRIIAALSCPDNNSAKRVYLAAKEMTEERCQFQYGSVSVGVHQTISLKCNCQNDRQMEARFDIGDFESAELQTRQLLSQEKPAFGLWYIKEGIDFMRHVKTALSDLYFWFDPQRVETEWKKEQSYGSSSVGPEPVALQSADVSNFKPTPEPKIETGAEALADAEDIADIVGRLIKEGKGRWVEQEVIIDKMMKDNPRKFSKWDIAKKALGRLRETENMRAWSEKQTKPAIGQDQAGNFLEQNGDRTKKQSLSYRYLLVTESSNTVSPPVSHSTPHLQ